MMRSLVPGVVAVVVWGTLRAMAAGPLLALQAPVDDLKMMYIAGLKKGAAPLRTDYMNSNMYVLGGGNRHTLNLELDDGVIVVDTKAEPWRDAQFEKIQLATDLPITILVNTNPGGALTNTAFTDATTIIAHENTRARLAKQDGFAGDNARFLPNRMVTDRLSIPLRTIGVDGTNRVDLYHFGRAHSDGDIIPVFPSLAVAYFGELLPEQGLPIVDVTNGGSLLEFPDTLARAAEALKDAGIDCIVPARAPLPFKTASRWFSDRMLAEYVLFLRAVVEHGRSSAAAGRSLDEAVAALPGALGEPFAAYNLDRAKESMEILYRELR
ncbi:MAG: hypothetical protein FJW23_14100 [Acidimicrobiia bacterium]|nr:hypothetical protein [Acidimicrobiia bacterium]